MAVLALVVALVVGSLIGILRTLPNRGFVCARQCLDRAVPQHPAAGPDLPLVPRAAGDLPGLRGVPSFVLVVFALGFFTSARIAEQVKAGIQSLPQAASATPGSRWA